MANASAIRRLRRATAVSKLLSVALFAGLIACASVPESMQVHPLPLAPAATARSVILETLAARARMALGEGNSVFVAANLVNAESVLAQWPGVLSDVAAALSPGRLFVSVVESGSTDGTREALLSLGAALSVAGVRHHVSIGGSGGWRDACADVATGGGHSRAACEAAKCGTSGRLRDCNAQIRIAVMAALRNRALAPLLDGAGPYEPNAVSEAPHLGLTGRVTVLFLNDVLLYAEDALELLATGGGDYDLACGMDFEGLKLYDTWVLRDLTGSAASDWFPFFREASARAALRAGAPARVYSCWNGAVALPSAIFLRDGVRFRSWAEGEPRSDAGGSSTGSFSADCPVSECALLAKDIWAHSANPSGARIFVNPRVHLAYNVATELWQRTLMRAANALLLTWSNRLGAMHHSLRATTIGTPLGSVARMDFRKLLPSSIACGLADEWGPW